MESQTAESESSGRLLAAELRQLRELAGESGRALAHRIGISQPTVSRIESGRMVPALPVVVAWGKALGASQPVQDRLIFLVKAAHNESRSWQEALRQRGHLQDDVEARESLAHTVLVYQPAVVPGLLQTPEYARSVFSLFQVPYGKDDLTAAVAARLRRQAAVYENKGRFEFLITEAALRWRPGPKEMLLAQLDQVASVSALDNVCIGLIPSDARALTLHSHGFVIYESENHGSFASVDTIHSNIAVNDPDDVGLYQDRWSLLRRMAIFDDAADRFLARLAADIRALADG